MTSEIINFLRRERFKDAEAVLEPLERFLQRALKDGIPLHYGASADVTWRMLADRERCAASALFAVVSAAASRCPDLEEYGEDGRLTKTPRRFRIDVSDAHFSSFTYRALERLEATAFDGAMPALSRVNFSRARLNGANLINADLSGADLSRAALWSSNLTGANLSRVDLSRAILAGTNLGSANLSGADLSGAYLGGADLSGADLSGANLSGTFLTHVKSFPWEQLPQAHGDADTKLPPDVERPAHWLEPGA